jgi:hypothetical protein
MAPAGRFVLVLLIAGAGGACKSESDLLVAPDGGGGGGSGGATGGRGGSGGAVGDRGGAGGSLGGGGGASGGSFAGGSGGAAGGDGGEAGGRGGGGSSGSVGGGGGGGSGSSVGGRGGGGAGGAVGGRGGGAGGAVGGRGGAGGAAGRGGASGGSAGGGNSCASIGGAGGGSARGGSGGTPPAPSHARTTAPGIPQGRWVDRTPCRIPYAWPPAIGGSATFDADRQRVVLIGSLQNSGRGLEVWELDPTTGAWQDRVPCPLPASWPTTEGQFLYVGYDRNRHKTVLFDGAETWEWDGQAGTWELRASGGISPNGPTRVSSTVLEYDPQRRTMVLAGWDLFDWDGAAATWTRRWSAPDTGSPPLVTGISAYDPDRAVVMTFGDQRMWETNGARWIDRTPFTLPASWPTDRTGARLFYEPTTRKMILASGGANGSGAPDDLWAFDTIAGTFTAAPPGPRKWPPSGYAYAASTAGNGRVVMFDGTGPEFDPYLGQVLVWNVTGGPVTDLRPAHIPIAWPMMTGWVMTPDAYDVRRGRVVMFGGMNDGTVTGTSANLLEWNGQDGTWQDRTPARRCEVAWPPSRYYHAMAADSRRGKILVFGGQQITPDDRLAPRGSPTYQTMLSDYWEWDGEAGTFTQRSPADAGAAWPPAGTSSIDPVGAMTYDGKRDRVVLTGPYGQGPWELDPVAGIWTPPSNLAGAFVGDSPLLLHSVRDATTFAIGAENGSPATIMSWDPIGRAWTTRAAFDSGGPKWDFTRDAAIDPISGVLWAVSAQVWSWQPGGAWTDRSSIATPPNSGYPVPGGTVVFDERRGTLVLLVASWRPWAAIGVLELAVP